MKSGASLLPWLLAALGPGIAIVRLLGHLAADIIMVRVPDHKASDKGVIAVTAVTLILSMTPLFDVAMLDTENPF
ncbi:MAG: hypothetical protein WA778_15320 [Pseudolabrys sp.]